jgi:hypothetical protein
MAPVKFEDNIREKLESREIEPSGDAWKRLSERLDENSKKKNNYTFWYAIAASIIGVLIVVSVFSNRSDKLNENSIDFVDVHTSERDLPIENVPDVVENISEENINAILIPEASNSITLNTKKDSGKEKVLPKKKDLVLKNTTIEVSQAIAKTIAENQAGKISQIPEEIIRNDALLINKRIDELVAQRGQLQDNSTTVSLEEVNTLLTNAERKIQAEKILDSKKVDPVALLGDVEIEMENTFREKVFTALGDGYNIIKTAVVDRNN